MASTGFLFPIEHWMDGLALAWGGGRGGPWPHPHLCLGTPASGERPDRIRGADVAGLPRIPTGHVACRSLGTQGGSPGGPSFKAALVGTQHSWCCRGSSESPPEAPGSPTEVASVLSPGVGVSRGPARKMAQSPRNPSLFGGSRGVWRDYGLGMPGRPGDAGPLGSVSTVS